MIPRDTLKKLAEIHSANGTAISFYFRPETPQNLANQREPILIKNKVRELLGSLSELSGSSAGEDLQKILKISEELRTNPMPKAVFACKEHDFWWELDDIDAVTETRLTMGRHFELFPLLAKSQEEPRCCIVALDREKTRVFLMKGQEIVEQSEVMDEEPREVRNTGTGGSAQAERQKEEPVKQHFKFIADHLRYFLERGEFNLLIIGTRDELWAEIEPKLHSSLKQILIGKFSADPGLVTIEQVQELARSILDDRRKHEIQELLRTVYGEAQRDGLGAVGITNVVDALEKGEVQTLLIGDDKLGPGAECTNCGHVMLETQDKCEVCGREVIVFENVAECLIRKVMNSDNIDLEILPNHPQLKGLGGIAAQLRFRADQNTPQKVAS